MTPEIPSTSSANTHAVDLSTFDARALNRGRPKYIEVLWLIAKFMIVQSRFPWPSCVRKSLLVCFGAKIGKGFYIRPSVNVHFPWKLIIGDNVWIGEGCTILNLENVEIRSNSALAHEVYVSTGNHDIRKSDFPYANKPVLIESCSWIGTRAFIGAGVHVKRGAVVAAGAVVIKDVDEWTIVGGIPASKLGIRTIKKES